MNRAYLRAVLARGIAGLQHPVLATRAVHYYSRRACADMLARLGFYRYPHQIIFLAGMAMSGSTWMKNLLGGIPGYYSRRMDMPHEVHYQWDICDGAFSHVPRHGYALFKTHLYPRRENLDVLFRNSVRKVLITHRDLRDVAFGRYQRLVDVPKPRTAPDFVDYVALGKERALDDSIEAVATNFVPWIQGWTAIAAKDPENYLMVKYEDLRENTDKVLRDVLRFYEISLPDKIIAQMIHRARGRNSFKKNWESAAVLPFGISSNFRSGLTGYWREELSARHIEKCRVRFGQVLVDLKYEQDLNW